MFRIEPTFRSASVTARVAVHVFVSPGARDTGPVSEPQLMGDMPASGSAMNTFASVTLPVFLAASM